MIGERTTIPLTASLLSAAGLFFCVWVAATGGRELCVTEGCSLFQDFRIAGYSMWHGGSAFFASLLALCIFKRITAARILAATALAADIILLAVMIFTAPCMNCLTVGTLIALCAFSLRRTSRGTNRPLRGILFAWSLLLVCNAGNLARELAGPWPILSPSETASVRVWFSPSCPACRALTSQAENLRDASWFPVSENPRDIWLIAEMISRLNAGLNLPSAIEAAEKTLPPPSEFDGIMKYKTGLLRPDMLFLQFRLWRNMARVLASGSSRIPLVEFSGIPSFLQEGYGSSSENSSPSGPDSSIPELSAGGFCGGESEAPCTEPASGTSRTIDTSGM